MYKTIRHGENSLQYTILPQNDDFRIEGKLSSAGNNSNVSCSSKKSKNLKKRARRRSFFAYLGLIFICTVIIGAILIPFLVSAECLPNPKEWFLKTKAAFASHNNHNSQVRNNIGKYFEKFVQSTARGAVGTTDTVTTTTEIQQQQHQQQQQLQNIQSTIKTSYPVESSSISTNKNISNNNNNNNNNTERKKYYTQTNIVSGITDDGSISTGSSFDGHFVAEARPEDDGLNILLSQTIDVTTSTTTTTATKSTPSSSPPPLPPSTTIIVKNSFKNSIISATPTILTRIMQVPLLKSASKKTIIPPVLAKTNPLISSSTTTTTAIDNNSQWLNARWPYIDPSTYFQWTGYKPEDSVLLPALLGVALIGIIFVVTICLIIRNRSTIVMSVRKRSRHDVEEPGAEDNTTLLTNTNISDEE